MGLESSSGLPFVSVAAYPEVLAIQIQLGKGIPQPYDIHVLITAKAKGLSWQKLPKDAVPLTYCEDEAEPTTEDFSEEESLCPSEAGETCILSACIWRSENMFSIKLVAMKLKSLAVVVCCRIGCS
ncbi:hypothetical protein GW17_00014720 [Ensete ventricosum]|nr:hypothetical protein GW17_00014720 [Ensete ventricosum]